MASMVDKSPLQRKRSFGGLINQPENMMRNESFNEKYALDNNLNGSITKRRRYLSSDTVKENELQHSFMSTPTMEFTHVNNVASGTNYNNMFSPVTTQFHYIPQQQQQPQQRERKAKRDFNMFNNHNNEAEYTDDRITSSSSSSSSDRMLLQEREVNENTIFDLQNKVNESVNVSATCM